MFIDWRILLTVQRVGSHPLPPPSQAKPSMSAPPLGGVDPAHTISDGATPQPAAPLFPLYIFHHFDSDGF